MSAPGDQDISEKVHRHRNAAIIGDCIDMVPYDATHDPEVVRLRNLPEVRYFLNLAEPANIEGQSKWRVGYEDRNDDIMWLLRNKSGEICGINRLYDISKTSAEKGSQIVDPQFARLLPVALESEIRIIDIAFDVYGVREVIATIREDNEKVISMNQRFGFHLDGEVQIRGVNYLRYVLSRKDWSPDSFKKVIAHWSNRRSRLRNSQH